jgi:sugar-specific transcriptional regulator TrmB
LSEAVARQLLDFGLTDKEASIYLALLRNGKARAGEIARKLQLNRMIVYRVLTKLQERELVRATVEKPMKFIPVTLEKALDILIKETEGHLNLMKDRYDSVVDGWKYVHSEPPVTDVLSFKIVQGRKQIYDLLMNMFNTADKWIRLVTTKRDLLRFQYVDLDDSMRRAAKRGVKIQIVVQYEDDKLDIVRHYAGFAAVKVVPISKATRLFIADDKEMIIAFTTDDSMALNTKHETCLRIQSTEGRSLDTVVDIFSNFWESADELDALDSLSVAEDVKTFKTVEAFDRTLRSMVESTESELIVGIPKDMVPSIKESVMTQTANKAGKVYVRMLLYVDQEDFSKRLQLLDRVDAYHTELLQSMQFVIRDRKEILISLCLKGSGTEKRVRHIWSNSPLYVESMTSLLSDLWNKSAKVDDRIGELRRREMSTIGLAEFKTLLERSNWKVESPATLMSRSGERAEFGLVAQDSKGRKLAADFINGGDERNLAFITSFSGKAIDAEVDALFLLSVPYFSPQESSLARYFNIRLIEAESREGLSSKLSKMSKEFQELLRVTVQTAA